MIATHDPEGLLILLTPEATRVPNTPRFKGFYSAWGWPDLAKQGPYAQTWFTVIGEQEDGIYAVLTEVSGDLGDVAKVAINQKDIFLLKSMFVDKTDEESLRFLRNPDNCDGLTYYAWDDWDKDMDKPTYRRLGSHWPHFRDYETYAALVPVRDTIRLNIRSGYDRLVAMVADGRLVITPSCRESQDLIRARPPLRDIIEHPLTKALVWCVSMMELNKSGPAIEKGAAEPWYQNL